MKKFITYICLTGSLLVFMSAIDVERSLALFLFAGVIPGTNIVVSPVDMMAATATAIVVVILRLAAWPQIKAVFDQPKAKDSAHRTV